MVSRPGWRVDPGCGQERHICDSSRWIGDLVQKQLRVMVRRSDERGAKAGRLHRCAGKSSEDWHSKLGFHIAGGAGRILTGSDRRLHPSLEAACVEAKPRTEDAAPDGS